MMRTTKTIFAVAAFCMLGTLAHAAPFHYNVDEQTLPFGPVELVSLSPPTFAEVDGSVDQYTFHFGAKNNGASTQLDVLFLLQFVFDPNIAYTFNDGVDTWTGAGNTVSFPGLPIYLMTDTDAPLSWTKLTPTRTGTLVGTDTIPYVQIGDIGPGVTAAFNLVVQVNEDFGGADVVGSFVALPEPSTFVLLGIGAFGLMAARRMRSRK